MLTHETTFFISFLVLVIALLFIDLGVFNRKSHEISMKEALLWTIVWILFAGAIYLFIRLDGDTIHHITTFGRLQEINRLHGHEMHLNPALGLQPNLELYRQTISLQFLTGYLLEYSLSVDNIFVMILLFLSFGVPKAYYHRVLFWGILGAIIMRFLFIYITASLIQQFEWILWIFGALLIYSGIKMYIERNKEEHIEVSNHPVVKFSSKHFRVFPSFAKDAFFVKQNGNWMITPLLLVVLVIEFSDVIFAVDSVPAIFSVTKDPFIVFTSNICAILGLRSLFFVVSHVIGLFHYLKIGLAVLLTFIGVKMLLDGIFHLPISTSASLVIIVAILGISILASVIFPKKATTHP
ncbi:TerC family protein [Microbacter margulisiae]|uniref:Tellurite resistance protein TerC n=1 Tax=Microbacter margulisiae TaxID=1350067 RepID=A0A7W5H278_9PORP|nr:TerC family protein [Microbacter margulisiae]MBB3187460.1 tellurite resistance protein TerC [Microbacter margulisiae]